MNTKFAGLRGVCPTFGAPAALDRPDFARQLVERGLECGDPCY